MEINSEIRNMYLVVDAWAMMFPPIGFLGSAWNMEAPSTWATTWFVMTIATPNWMEKWPNYNLYHYTIEGLENVPVPILYM